MDGGGSESMAKLNDSATQNLPGVNGGGTTDIGSDGGGSLNMSGLDGGGSLDMSSLDGGGSLDMSSLDILDGSMDSYGVNETSRESETSPISGIPAEADMAVLSSNQSPVSNASGPTLFSSSDPRAAARNDESGSEFRGKTSTPMAERSRGRPRFRDSPVRTRGPRLSARDWSFMPGRRNRRRRRDLRRRIRYSDEEEVDVPPERNKRATGLRWKTRDPRKLKFVDDGMMVARINMESGMEVGSCLLYTSPSPRDRQKSRMPSSA